MAPYPDPQTDDLQAKQAISAYPGSQLRGMLWVQVCLLMLKKKILVNLL